MAGNVTCTKQYYFYRGNKRVSSSSEKEYNLTPGLNFTPGHQRHMPSYDESIYTSYKITYNGRNYTYSSIVCPNSNFTVYYYFYGYAESIGGTKVKKWSWNSSNGAASSQQTKSAYAAISNQGETSKFSYLVWNDMADKVYETLSAKNLRWNSRFASYENTRMSSSDKTLTAARFNSLRYNIGLHYSTGINTVNKGDTIYGWYFTTLTNCLNNWIDT